MKSEIEQETPQRSKRLLRRPQVEVKVNMRRTAIYESMKAGHFPLPVRLPGSTAVRWREADIDDWIDSLQTKVVSSGSEPDTFFDEEAAGARETQTLDAAQAQREKRARRSTKRTAETA